MAEVEAAQYKWKPPTLSEVDAKHLYLQHKWWHPTEGTMYTAWQVDSEDRVLSQAVVTCEGDLWFKGKLVPGTDDPETLKVPAIVRTIVNVAQAVFTRTEFSARAVSEAGIKVSTGRFKLQVQAPRKWTGEGNTKNLACDLPVWLMEMKDFLRLTQVDADIQADVACTYLSGSARGLYNTRRVNESKARGFEHTMIYMEATLRDLYVPRAQKADLAMDFLRHKWVPAFDDKYTLELACQVYEAQKVKLHNEGMEGLPEEWECHMFLASLPEVVSNELKQAENGKAHTKWEQLKSQVAIRGDMVMALYRKALSNGNLCQASALQPLHDDLHDGLHEDLHDGLHHDEKRVRFSDEPTVLEYVHESQSEDGSDEEHSKELQDAEMANTNDDDDANANDDDGPDEDDADEHVKRNRRRNRQ